MNKWLTPQNAPPTDFWVRRLFIPADPAYGALVSGALINLCYASSFEQYGAATPDEVAEAFSAMYDKYVTNDQEPPFWEDDTDVGQEAPSGAPWYETLSDWIIEGFLAISGFPTAAIVYSTSVPKIRLAIRNHDLGSLFRVLLDNLEMYTGDSYGPISQLVGHTLDLESFAVANDLGPGPWTLRIEHNGPGGSLPPGENGQLQVVRKRLSDEMPIQFRQTGNLIEYSDDSGTTWSTVADISATTSIDPNTLVVDHTNHRVGFGTNAPDVPVHIEVPGTSPLELPVDDEFAAIVSNLTNSEHQGGLFIQNSWAGGVSTPFLVGGNFDGENFVFVPFFRVNGIGQIGIRTNDPQSVVDINADGIRIRVTKTPTGSADSSGQVGDIAWDTDYVYVKTAAGAWKRAALSTF